MTLVVYYSDTESIICTLENEKKAVRLYFTEGGRNMDEYNRSEFNNDIITIGPRLVICP